MKKIDWKKVVELIKNPKVYLAVLGVVIFGLIFFSVYFYMFFHTSAQKAETKIEISIKSGEGLRLIGKDLEEKKIIKHSFPVLVYLKLRGLAGDIKAGEYEIPANSTPLEVIDILTKGKVASIKITIPEGWTVTQTAEYLAKKEIVSKEQFLTAVKKKAKYDFLKDKPDSVDLEGFLFPDTYQISKQATADEIVSKMLANFDKKVTSEMRAQVSASDYNLYQVVTLASIVEKEVSKPQDRKIVAGIFLSRLEEGMKLQSDVTLQYFLGEDKKTFSYDETQINSPYNTYMVDGLPVGPISNPGLESINAVLNPEKTDFRYFLAAKDGTTYYSKTLEEHEEKKAKYLN